MVDLCVFLTARISEFIQGALIEPGLGQLLLVAAKAKRPPYLLLLVTMACL